MIVLSRDPNNAAHDIWGGIDETLVRVRSGVKNNITKFDSIKGGPTS